MCDLFTVHGGADLLDGLWTRIGRKRNMEALGPSTKERDGKSVAVVFESEDDGVLCCPDLSDTFLKRCDILPKIMEVTHALISEAHCLATRGFRQNAFQKWVHWLQRMRRWRGHLICRAEHMA